MKVTWLTIFYNGAGDRNNMKNYGTTERIAWLARGVGVIRFENDLGFSMGLEEYVSPKK